MSPPNVLITKHGEVKIVDFGLAKASSQLEKSEAGIIKGKFSYLSPEAALGQEVDHRTDIFAVGIILWEMLAGRRLFIGDTDFATVKQVQQAQIPPLSQINKDVPKDLERILARALARDPSSRYLSARDLARDLTEFLYKFGRPVSAFDIAELVRGAMAQRKKTQPDKASIIDKLIEEALFEFTSLQDDKAGGGGGAAKNEPLKLEGFEQLDNFAESLVDDIARGSGPAGVHEGELGNLAALEDSEDDGPASSRPGSLADEVEAEPSDSPAVPPKRSLSVPPSPQVAAFAAKQSSDSPAAAPANAGGTMKALLLVAALAVIAAGAWFGGLIPH
jgi:serine/threonine-protein kinase